MNLGFEDWKSEERLKEKKENKFKSESLRSDFGEEGGQPFSKEHNDDSGGEEKIKGKKKILIIDDDLDFVDATKAVLQNNYEVITASDGEDGWRKLEANPDLVILDVLMNRRGEGFIFCRKMKKDQRFSNIPIIMLTSMRQQTGFWFLKDDPRDARFLPVEEFLEKPIQPSELILKIESLLKEKEKKAGG